VAGDWSDRSPSSARVSSAHLEARAIEETDQELAQHPHQPRTLVQILANSRKVDDLASQHSVERGLAAEGIVGFAHQHLPARLLINNLDDLKMPSRS